MTRVEIAGAMIALGVVSYSDPLFAEARAGFETCMRLEQLSPDQLRIAWHYFTQGYTWSIEMRRRGETRYSNDG